MPRTLSPLEAALLGILSVGWRTLPELNLIFDPDEPAEDVAGAIDVLLEEKLITSWGDGVLHTTQLGQLTANQQRKETLLVYHRRRARHTPLGSRLRQGRA
jgi:hypothetical protein